MASYSSLTALIPVQSQLDYALEDVTADEEKENLVYQYLNKLDDKGDLKIPDFEPGECCKRALDFIPWCGKCWLTYC